MSVPVPRSISNRQFASIRDEVLSEVEKVFASQHFILGEQGALLERELAADLGVADAIGMSSGTDALLAALMALGVKAGDEVVVPAFSFFATAGTVARLGAVPVFSDIDRATFNATAEDLAKKIGPKTRVLIPVHLYGLCADMDAISALASARGIAVVEDACQAIGASFRGRPAGTLSSIGAFSFFPTKNLGAAGDAGMAVTNDPALAGRLRHLRVHGMNPKYYHSEIGGNFRLDEIQAAVLRVKRRRLPEWNARRRAIAARYRELLAPVSDRVILPSEPAGAIHVYHQFVVRVPRRDEVRARLSKAGIGTEVYYPVPLHLQQCFTSLGGRPGDCPEAEKAAAEVLALPVWPEMTPAEVDSVAGALSEAVE